MGWNHLYKWQYAPSPTLKVGYESNSGSVANRDISSSCRSDHQAFPHQLQAHAAIRMGGNPPGAVAAAFQSQDGSERYP
jgi:hypothetical protein